MRRLCLLLAIVIACVFAASAQQCKDYAPAGSVMIICPPADWVSKTEKGRKHPSFEKKVGPATFPPSMMLDEDRIEGPVEIMIYGLIKGHFEMQDGPDKITNKRVVDMSEFKTTSGVKGIKLVAEMTMGSVPARMVYYLFDTPGDIKVTVTGVSGADDAAAGTAFDAAARSLRIAKAR